jgi:anti-anti-sigma factor
VLTGVRWAFAETEGAQVPVSLQRRRVGDINVIACSGKIVGGPETDELQRVFDGLLPLEPHVVLNVAEVTFLDSAGIGALVRLLHRTRRAFGDLKLCHVPPRVAEVLRITRLGGVFNIHAREDEAIAAFYGPSPSADVRPVLGGDILCVDESPDVLAYICGVLREAGYRALPCGNLADATVLVKVSRPRVVVIGSSARARLDSARAGALEGGGVAILDLPDAFASHDPVESSSQLLSRVRALAGEPA